MLIKKKSLSAFCLSLDNNNKVIFHLLMSKTNEIIPFSFHKNETIRKITSYDHFPQQISIPPSIESFGNNAFEGYNSIFSKKN